MHTVTFRPNLCGFHQPYCHCVKFGFFGLKVKDNHQIRQISTGQRQQHCTWCDTPLQQAGAKRKRERERSEKICFTAILIVVLCFVLLCTYGYGKCGHPRVEVITVIYLAITPSTARSPRPSQYQSLSQEVRLADRLARALSPSLHEAKQRLVTLQKYATGEKTDLLVPAESNPQISLSHYVIISLCVGG